MQVSRIRALRGPNLWTHHTAVEAVVSCSESKIAIGSIPGFEQRLRERFPQLPPLQPSGHNDIVSIAQVLELATLALQAEAGCPVTFSRTTPTVEAGVFQVVVRIFRGSGRQTGAGAGAGTVPRRR